MDNRAKNNQRIQELQKMIKRQQYTTMESAAGVFAEKSESAEVARKRMIQRAQERGAFNE